MNKTVSNGTIQSLDILEMEEQKHNYGFSWLEATVRPMQKKARVVLSDGPCEPKGSPFNPMLSLSSIAL